MYRRLLIKIEFQIKSVLKTEHFVICSNFYILNISFICLMHCLFSFSDYWCEVNMLFASLLTRVLVVCLSDIVFVCVVLCWMFCYVLERQGKLELPISISVYLKRNRFKPASQFVK